MDINDYLWMSIIIGFMRFWLSIVTAIYALGLLDWLIGPGLRQGNEYDNPLPKNEWMNIFFQVEKTGAIPNRFV